MRRIEAQIRPELLVWARETAGLTIEEVANKLRKAPVLITSWERGELRPFMGQLRRLADIYKRPLSDFFLAERPQERPIPRDFRRSPGEIALVYSPTLRRQLRLAQERRDLAVALYQELAQPIPEIAMRIEPAADPEATGERVRRFLDVDFEEQKRWGAGRPAYKAWRARIEKSGILVFQFENVLPREAWGFSVADGRLPTIGINRKLAPNGRTFTLLHEFVHVLLRGGGLCDTDDITPRGADELRTEAFCNRVAAAALMPGPVFRAHEVIGAHDKARTIWDDNEIARLASTFGVSREAVVRRLETFGLTTMDFYLRKRDQYRRERDDERGRMLAAAKVKIARNMPQEAISNLGRRFVALVLQNYQDERITLLDASDYLGVRAEKVRKVEELASGW